VAKQIIEELNAKHIKHVYENKELQEIDTFRNFRNVSNQPIKHYNLDMINKKLIAWQKATNALAQEFIIKYFLGFGNGN
jgi:F0F1-type ATP synthase gamma subunit